MIHMHPWKQPQASKQAAGGWGPGLAVWPECPAGLSTGVGTCPAKSCAWLWGGVAWATPTLGLLTSRQELGIF